MRTARAKGLSPCRVIGVHALRNALIPVVTVIGLQIGTLLAGAVLTETIFSWPGVGKWLIESIGRRDYPALQGGIMLISSIVILVNLLVDLALRPHQPEDPPCPLTSPLDAPIATRGRRRPARFAAFWRCVPREPRRRPRPRRRRRHRPRRDLRGRRRAAFARSSSSATSCKLPPVWSDGGAWRFPLGTDARRPRHALAPHLRRAASRCSSAFR